jgi:pSer/pThr/pTyr-binding forkhead associated (FHA) protein
VPVKKATIIQSAVVEKETGDTVAERRKLTGFLVTYTHSPNGEFYPLYEGKNSIGRTDACSVFIQNDTKVSEKHLSILYRTVDRKFKFKDEQSSNGTFVNDELTDEGELKNLDRIRIGNTTLLFMEIPNLIEN